MEMLLFLYGLIAIGAFGMLLYVKMQKKKSSGSLRMSGEMLLIIVLMFVVSSSALVLNMIEFENRIVTLLNTTFNLLMLVYVVSLDKNG